MDHTTRIMDGASTSLNIVKRKSGRKKYHKRSFWRYAKKIFQVLSPKRCTQTVTPEAAPSDIYKRIQTNHKCTKQMAEIISPLLKQLSNYYDINAQKANMLERHFTMPQQITLPPLKLQDSVDDEIEVITNYPDVILQYLLPEFDLNDSIETDGTITIQEWQAELLMERIGFRVDFIEHLWLETSINGDLCAFLLNSADIKPQSTTKLEKLTVVGGDECDFEQISKLIERFSKTIIHLRLRQFYMESRIECMDLWSSIEHCYYLEQFQYETSCFDSFSHCFIANALANKINLKEIELGGVKQFSEDDLTKILANSRLTNLAICAPSLTFQSFMKGGNREAMRYLNTLLVQCPMTFATENQHQRDLIVDLLQTMKPEAVLEVTHTVHNKVTLAAKLMSYWLELSRETGRAVKVKFLEISQIRVDQAIGRLLRKCDNVFKAAFSGNSLLLIRGSGRLYVLDKYTWFGDDE